MKTYIVITFDNNKATIDRLYAFKEDANKRKERLKYDNSSRDPAEFSVHVITKSIKSLSEIKVGKCGETIFLYTVNNTRKKRG